MAHAKYLIVFVVSLMIFEQSVAGYPFRKCTSLGVFNTTAVTISGCTTSPCTLYAGQPYTFTINGFVVQGNGIANSLPFICEVPVFGIRASKMLEGDVCQKIVPSCHSSEEQQPQNCPVDSTSTNVPLSLKINYTVPLIFGMLDVTVSLECRTWRDTVGTLEEATACIQMYGRVSAPVTIPNLLGGGGGLLGR